jgi:hypothetical protein
MLKVTFATVAGLAAAGSLPAALPSVAAPKASVNCVNKAGQGTNTTEDGAKFQAYEAILQATDWGMWASWMASSQKIGVAPGYDVSGLRFKCTTGTGLGATCVGRAILCKKA